MASNKDPSQYDRSIIGSSEELEEYGVWVKSEPQDLSPVTTDTREAAKPEEDFSPELAGDAPDINAIDADPWLSENPADMAAAADFGLSSADGALFNDGLDFMDADTETEYVKMEPLGGEAETGEPAPVSEWADAAAEGDGLSALSMVDFLPAAEYETAPPSPFPEIGEQEPGNAVDLSTQLLMKIVEELSSIKGELSSLKRELSRSKHPAAEAAEAEEQTGGGGFFDEAEDEKIALTGDELNSFLTTADFPAEAAAAEEEEAVDPQPADRAGTDTERPKAPGFSEPLLESEDAFFSGIDAAIEDLPETDDSFIFPAETREIPPEQEAPPEMAASPELEMLRETGVEPMTPAPEDIDFLLEDPSLNLPFDDTSSFDFEDAVIGEPPFDFEDAAIGEPFIDFEDAAIEEPPLEFEDAAIEEPSIEDPFIDFEEPLAAPGSGEDGTDAGGALELPVADSGGSPEGLSGELSGAFPPDDDFANTAGISLDSLPGLPPAEEAPEHIGDTLEDGAYDQAIPDGFLIESGDSPAGEQTSLNGGLPETGDDSPADLSAPEDMLELGIEDFPDFTIEDFADFAAEESAAGDSAEDGSAGLEPVPEGPGTEKTPAGEEEDGVPAAEAPAAIPAEEDKAGISPPSAASPNKADGNVHPAVDVSAIPSGIRLELRSVLSYMDQLLESLPENKIEEFAKSEYFDTYKKLFEDLGLA
ncbi:MAG: hypothetical protein LBE17_09905 [Treponema sp.]|jgi:hypothetical protein|nr:hypothetical protein [Treponema sp.]